jgi:hypothetical protein
MKSSKLFLSAALLGLVQLAPSLASAQAGNGGRGGGMVILCYQSIDVRNEVDRKLKEQTSRLGTIDSPALSVELRLDNLRAKPVVLDWAEAQKLIDKEWEIPMKDFQSYDFTDEQVHDEVWNRHYRRLETMDPRFWSIFNRKRTQPEHWLMDSNGPLRVNDANWVLTIPESCIPVQAAYYDETLDYVHLDKRIARLLDLEQRVALWLHEDMTHFYRVSMAQFHAMAGSLGRTCDDERYVPGYVAPTHPVPNTDIARALSTYLTASLPIGTPRYQALAEQVAVSVKFEQPRHILFISDQIHMKREYTDFTLAWVLEKLSYAPCNSPEELTLNAAAKW